jgi:hypothetical protein
MLDQCVDEVEGCRCLLFIVCKTEPAYFKYIDGGIGRHLLPSAVAYCQLEKSMVLMGLQYHCLCIDNTLGFCQRLWII